MCVDTKIWSRIRIRWWSGSVCTETHRSLLAAFAYTFCTGLSIKNTQSPPSNQTSAASGVLQPHIPSNTGPFLEGAWPEVDRLSSGFMLINTALELCEHVMFTGFWPFGTDPAEQSVPYHYYDELSPHRYMHKMPEEFVRLLQLHSQGALTLHLTPCMDV